MKCKYYQSCVSNDIYPQCETTERNTNCNMYRFLQNTNNEDLSTLKEMSEWAIKAAATGNAKGIKLEESLN